MKFLAAITSVILVLSCSFQNPALAAKSSKSKDRLNEIEIPAGSLCYKLSNYSGLCITQKGPWIAYYYTVDHQGDIAKVLMAYGNRKNRQVDMIKLLERNTHKQVVYKCTYSESKIFAVEPQGESRSDLEAQLMILCFAVNADEIIKSGDRPGNETLLISSSLINIAFFGTSNPAGKRVEIQNY